MTHGPRQLREILEAHGLSPSRALGQNFVVDANTVRRIARLASVGPDDVVLEIGAGLGSLTLALAETGAVVHALELDRYLIAPLREVLADTAVVVHHGDALSVDVSDLTGAGPVVVVANLPYNVAAPVVLRLLESQPTVTRLLVMVQYEVGQRLAAEPGDEAFGAVSLRVAYFARARVVGRVGPNVFYPRPRVDSALVEIVRRPRVAIDPDQVGEEALFAVIHEAFAHRRQMLRRTLGTWADEEVFARAGIEPTRRPEELSLEQFARLAAQR